MTKTIFMIFFMIVLVNSLPTVDPSHMKQIRESLFTGSKVPVLVGFEPENSNKRGETILDEEEKIRLGWENVRAELSQFERKRASKEGSSASTPISVHQVYSVIPTAVFEVDSEGFNQLLTMNTVTFVEIDGKKKLFLQEALNTVGVRQVWDTSLGGDSKYDGTGWTVAVLDNGFHTDNSFFSSTAGSRIVGEGCFAGTNRSVNCPNGSQMQAGSGSSNAPQSAIHGTHCAGIVGGNQANLKGAAPGVSFYLINVFGIVGGTASSDTAQDSNILSGMQTIYNERNNFKFAAVSMSLGGGAATAYCDSQSRSYATMVSTLKSAGIAVIVASGNEFYKDSIAHPACLSGVVSVGATTKGDVPTSFSNSASFLSLVAPGVLIYSSTTSTSFGFLSGTSMATPLVAGCYAVMRSVYGSKPSVDIITKRLQDTGKSVKDPFSLVTSSRVDMKNALAGKKVTCGDGTKDDLEQCDDGNTISGDGCSSACKVEWPYVCSGTSCSLATVTNTSAPTTQLIGNAESGSSAGNWQFVDGPGERVYAGSRSYGVAGDSGDSNLVFSANIPAFTNSATAGRRVFMTFQFRTEYDSNRGCPSSVFVTVNGDLVQSTSFPYNAPTDISASNPSYYPGSQGWCKGQVSANEWNKVAIDVTSFTGKTVAIQFTMSSNGAGNYYAFLDDIYLNYQDVTVSGYTAPTQNTVNPVAIDSQIGSAGKISISFFFVLLILLIQM